MITQGDWNTHNDIDGSEVLFADTDKGHVTIGRIYTGDNVGQRGSGIFPSFEEGMDNSQLIKTAPKLLQTLKDIRDHEDEKLKLQEGYDKLVHQKAIEIIAEIHTPKEPEKTKAEQLRFCKTKCLATKPGHCELHCPDNKYKKIIEKSLKGVINLYPYDEPAPYFGKAPCMTCNDTLAGDRYRIQGTDTDNKPVEFMVCTDCFEYLFG